jgi:hypothetical protein
MDFLLNNKLVGGLVVGGVVVVLVKLIVQALEKKESTKKQEDPVITPKEFRKFKLIEKKNLTHGELVACPVNLYRFEIPDGRPLGLPTGQHIAVRYVHYCHSIINM